ncbi:MAG: hypothetical protein IT303_13055 [Dehalococcoidia bacterium]|nr:hypothetical protein [Dehalococcoidia bacterium]
MIEERLQLWSELDCLEEDALTRLTPELAPLEPAIAILHDAANGLTELPGEWQDEEHILVAGGCLKRALDDLRAMWLLLRRGYTSAGAAAAADLWEHSMLAACCARDPNLASQFLMDVPGDPTLSALALCEALAKITHSPPHAESASADEIEGTKLQFYAGYKWLCQLKHPSARATIHHSAGTTIGEDGVLGLMAHPDSRESDLPVKQMVLASAYGALDRAITHFGVALNIDPTTPEAEEWLAECGRGWDILKEHVDPRTFKLPFSIFDTKQGRRLRELWELAPRPEATA